MRIVKFKRSYGVGEESAPWENKTLDEFIFQMPELGFVISVMKVLPPLNVLNGLFEKMDSDSGMGGSIEWKSFSIDSDEYDELVEFLSSDPEREITIERQELPYNDFNRWRQVAQSKYRPKRKKKANKAFKSDTKTVRHFCKKHAKIPPNFIAV